MRASTVAAAIAGIVLGATAPGLASQFTDTTTSSTTVSTATLAAPTLSLTCSGALGGGTVSASWPSVTGASTYTLTRTGGTLGTLTVNQSLLTYGDTIPVLSLATTFTYTVVAKAGTAWTSPTSTARTATFSLLSCSIG